jgi:preprotein translocase subunit YajC
VCYHGNMSKPVTVRVPSIVLFLVLICLIGAGFMFARSQPAQPEKVAPDWGVILQHYDAGPDAAWDTYRSAELIGSRFSGWVGDVESVTKDWFALDMNTDHKTDVVATAKQDVLQVAKGNPRVVISGHITSASDRNGAFTMQIEVDSAQPIKP